MLAELCFQNERHPTSSITKFHEWTHNIEIFPYTVLQWNCILGLAVSISNEASQSWIASRQPLQGRVHPVASCLVSFFYYIPSESVGIRAEQGLSSPGIKNFWKKAVSSSSKLFLT